MKTKLVRESLNENKNVFDLIGSEKMNILKDIGWTDKEIYDIVNFLMLGDDALKNAKLTSLKGVPRNIKGSLENLPTLTSLKGT